MKVPSYDYFRRTLLVLMSVIARINDLGACFGCLVVVFGICAIAAAGGRFLWSGARFLPLLCASASPFFGSKSAASVS